MRDPRRLSAAIAIFAVMALPSITPPPPLDAAASLPFLIKRPLPSSDRPPPPRHFAAIFAADATAAPGRFYVLPPPIKGMRHCTVPSFTSSQPATTVAGAVITPPPSPTPSSIVYSMPAMSRR